MFILNTGIETPTPLVYPTLQTGTPIYLCITNVDEGRLKREIPGDLKKLD